MPKIVVLWTDAAMWLMVAALLGYAWLLRRRPGLAADWRRVFADPAALASSLILALCLAVTLLDSLHFRPRLPRTGASDAVAYDPRTRSVLDALLSGLIETREVTYSRPLSYLGFTKESVEAGGVVRRVAPRLVHGGAHLQDPDARQRVRRRESGAAGLALTCRRSVMVVEVVMSHHPWRMRGSATP